MPTTLKFNGFRFFFYSNEHNEPSHIHVEQAENTAKYWLVPVELVSPSGFSAKEINQLQKLVIDNRVTFLQAWHEYFNH